ncbi:hypothetical protein KCP77_06610 [Salmonella enterica subsp. enterica]|nr:hypothetical protein KCP77_06610 [Salmonella enterica subsp. enterica]
MMSPRLLILPRLPLTEHLIEASAGTGSVYYRGAVSAVIAGLGGSAAFRPLTVEELLVVTLRGRH